MCRRWLHRRGRRAARADGGGEAAAAGEGVGVAFDMAEKGWAAGGTMVGLCFQAISGVWQLPFFFGELRQRSATFQHPFRCDSRHLQGGRSMKAAGEGAAANAVVVHVSGKDATPEASLKASQVKLASWAQLFQFADRTDLLLMLTGCGMAAAVGAALPIFIIVFADLLTAVGQGNVSDNSFSGPGGALENGLIMIYIGAASQAAGTIFGTCFELSKNRQMARLRKAYIRAIIRQDIGWFDTSDPQQLPYLIGSCTSYVADGIGSKTFNGAEFLGMGITGFVISFVYGWDIAIVMVLISPMIIFAGLYMSRVEKVEGYRLHRRHLKPRTAQRPNLLHTRPAHPARPGVASQHQPRVRRVRIRRRGEPRLDPYRRLAHNGAHRCLQVRAQC